MRRVVIILIKLGDGDPKKMDLTATIRTLIPVVYRVLHDVTNTHPLVPIYVQNKQHINMCRVIIDNCLM